MVEASNSEELVLVEDVGDEDGVELDVVAVVGDEGVVTGIVIVLGDGVVVLIRVKKYDRIWA